MIWLLSAIELNNRGKSWLSENGVFYNNFHILTKWGSYSNYSADAPM